MPASERIAMQRRQSASGWPILVTSVSGSMWTDGIPREIIFDCESQRMALREVDVDRRKPCPPQ